MNEQNKENNKPKWKKYLFNVHTLLILIAICILGYILIRFKNWGVHVDNEYIDKHGVYTDGKDTFDVIYPLTNDDGKVIANKSPHTILFLGNAPFAQDRNSENGVVNMIAKQTGATVYNCSVEGSFLAAKSDTLMHTNSGLDVYNFYWLCLYLILGKDVGYFDWLESLPGGVILPEEKEIRNTLETIDMSTVDTIAIMYDASDYYAGSMIYDPNAETEVMSFAGNLKAGLELLRTYYPEVRIIVLSPTYAFGVEEDGSYVSSDIKIYDGGGTLSSYMMKECEIAVGANVSFLDNIYGTFNEDEAPEYLSDEVHLNQKGRELVVKRFIGALTQFDEKK